MRQESFSFTLALAGLLRPCLALSYNSEFPPSPAAYFVRCVCFSSAEDIWLRVAFPPATRGSPRSLVPSPVSRERHSLIITYTSIPKVGEGGKNVGWSPRDVQRHQRCRRQWRRLADRGSQHLLLIRRLRMDPHVLRPRPADGAGRGFLLQRSCPAQVSTGSHLAVHDEHSCRRFPVVLLGLFSYL